MKYIYDIINIGGENKMKGLDITKLEKEKNFIIVSSEDALRDVEPMIDNNEIDRIKKQVVSNDMF